MKPGVEVITPNPFSSGAARWNIMGAYGSQTRTGKSEAQGNAFLEKLLGNVVVQDDSGRAALQTFTGGKGDVLISYENEAIFAKQNGQDIDYVVPDNTLLIENPAAITSNSKHPKEAQAFLDFVRATRGAEDLRRERLPARCSRTPTRPARTSPTRRASSPSPTSAAGPAVVDKFFDPEKGIVTEIEREPRGLG